MSCDDAEYLDLTPKQQEIPAEWCHLGSCVAGHFVWHVYGYSVEDAV